MAKFAGLVKNEYIKTFKKISTKVMIILVILAGVALSGIAAFAKSQMSSNSYTEGYDAQSDYKSEIEWLEKTKPEGYENDLILYNYLLTLSNDDDTDDKRTTAFTLAENFQGSELSKYLDMLYKDDDWKQVYKALSDVSTSEAEKWEYQYRIDNNIPSGNTWRDELIQTAASAKATIESAVDKESDEVKAAKNNEALALYRLDNNIEYNTADSMSLFDAYEPEQVNFWTVFNQSASMVAVIGLLIIVIAGSSVAGEFSQGTIKFLLINPVKRWKILMAKYFTVISIGYLMLLLLYIVMIPLAGLFVGFDGLGASYIWIEAGTVHSVSGFVRAAEMYLINSISIVVMASLAFAVSSLFRSAAFSIGISVFLMLGGDTIVTLLRTFNQDWARFLIFSNTDLMSIANGTPLFAHQSLTFAIGVIIAHMVVFILTAWDGFVRREV